MMISFKKRCRRNAYNIMEINIINLFQSLFHLITFVCLLRCIGHIKRIVRMLRFLEDELFDTKYHNTTWVNNVIKNPTLLLLPPCGQKKWCNSRSYDNAILRLILNKNAKPWKVFESFDMFSFLNTVNAILMQNLWMQMVQLSLFIF